METPVETKPEEKKETPPANPTPAPDETARKLKELEDQLKERDSKIADLNTTMSTIQKRFEETKAGVDAGKVSQDVMERAKKIMENSSIDPDAAAKELVTLLNESQSNVSKSVVAQAVQTIQAQTTIEKLRAGVKSSNPEFDDEVVDLIMDRASMNAGLKNPDGTPKYKPGEAQKAIDDACQYVKSKFEAYAQKKNAAPPLPEGARAETGSNKAPEPPKVEKIPTAEEELEARRAGLQKKVL